MAVEQVITIHVAEVLSGCDTIVTPPRRVQLENSIFTAAIRIVVHKGGIEATFIVCYAQPWNRERVVRRWAYM